MKSINYLTFFEIAFSNFTISAIGYLCGFLKMFTSHEVSLILSIVNNISVPLLIFREVGRNGLKPKTWAPLLVSFLVEIIMHLILLIPLLFRKSGRRFQYLTSILSTTYFNGIYCGMTITQIVYGIDYSYIVVYCYIIHYIFVIPFHNILIYLCSEAVPEPDSDEIPNQTGNLEHGEKGEEEEEVLEDVIDEGDVENHVVVEIPASSSENSDSVEPVYDDPNDESSAHAGETPTGKNPNARPPLWRVILFSFLTFQNVCLILGLIWAATGWTMPLFLDTFTNDHEKAVMSVGLFAIGAYMWDHPFLGGNVQEVSLYFILHSVGMPLLAILFCFLLDLDHKVSVIVTLVHAMPCGLLGYSLSLHYQLKLLSPTFTFFWNNLLALPIQMLWVVIINETHLFQIEE
ncbi:Auxin Efflux Carrier family protein [Tritrichomonas foetus]|uniref:Auxin Efflux Carrier family protein n=1 Tax=Tritrichomonas foetus TaxID=1144522 RepID=A0A1J4KAS1_9EUKA|nr:Auxin Efflux Carrier family protein [Tritrichomonas foetus]|eukprot:OHT06774.1 Auxin Efflux Carrier family protein [Tritrichomonas foetus]